MARFIIVTVREAEAATAADAEADARYSEELYEGIFRVIAFPITEEDPK